MQITVTNQKTKSIRSASFEAGVGSQGTKNATANVTAAAARPTATTRTSTPLRTIASLLNPRPGRLLRTSVTKIRRSGRIRRRSDDVTKFYEGCFPRRGRGYTAPVGAEAGPRKETRWELA